MVEVNRGDLDPTGCSESRQKMQQCRRVRSTGKSDEYMASDRHEVRPDSEEGFHLTGDGIRRRGPPFARRAVVSRFEIRTGDDALPGCRPARSPQLDGIAASREPGRRPWRHARLLRSRSHPVRTASHCLRPPSVFHLLSRIEFDPRRRSGGLVEDRGLPAMEWSRHAYRSDLHDL